MKKISNLKPPYYALICSSKSGRVNELIELASKEKGFLGKDNSKSLSVSYWESMEDIKRLEESLEDKNYSFNICKIEDNYVC